MFDSVVLSTGGPDFYKKAFNDLDDASLKSRHDEEVVRQPRQARAPMSTRTSRAATGTSPPPWSSRATRCVQVMGDWAKGEFQAAKKTAGHRLPLLSASPAPTARDLQLRHVRHVQRSGRPQGRPDRAGHGHAVEELPVGLQRRQGFGSGPHRRAGHRLRRLRQEGHRRSEGGQRKAARCSARWPRAMARRRPSPTPTRTS